MYLWTDGTELYHHGIKGQKWGLRKYQNPDGSLTPAGRLRYLKNQANYAIARAPKNFRTGNFKNRQYVSKATLKSKTAEERRRNKQFDEQITKYYAKSTMGKRFLKTILFTPTSELTYNMARSSGEGRAKAFLRSVFDLNLAMFASAAAQTVNDQVLPKKQKYYEEYDAYVERPMTGAATINYLLGRAVNKAVRDTGGEYSLQQRALRKKYAGGKK